MESVQSNILALYCFYFIVVVSVTDHCPIFINKYTLFAFSYRLLEELLFFI